MKSITIVVLSAPFILIGMMAAFAWGCMGLGWRLCYDWMEKF